jgi:DNA-binding PadR family transcriptional regulator
MSPQVFQILLSLVDGPLHGYGIIQDVATRTSSEIRLTASTLYDALARLVDQDLIEEVDRAGPTRAQAPPLRNDSRRRYYALTADGRQAARREAARLRRLVDAARAKKLIAR